MQLKEMTLRVSLVSALALTISLAAAVSGWAMEPTKVVGTVTQEIAEFDNPEGSVFSADGKSLYISNAGIWDGCEGFAFVEGAGYISKLSVGSDGKVAMVKKDFITGLTTPLGMAVLDVATGKFPAGSIFIVVGAPPLGTKDCKPIKDATHVKTGVLVFDHSGKKLGMLDMGAGTLFEKVSGSPVVFPNALDFDRAGNLYVADTAFSGGSVEPAIVNKPGIWKIMHGAIDALASRKGATQDVQFIAMAGGPDGVEVSPIDDMVHVNTVGAVVGMPDEAKGGMWRLTPKDFAAGKLPAPFASGLGGLDGTDFTVGGVRIDTEIMNSGKTGQFIVVTPVALANGKDLKLQPRFLKLDKDAKLTGPADVDLLKLADGSYLMAVPELSVGSKGAKDEVTIIKIPAAIDKEM